MSFPETTIRRLGLAAAAAIAAVAMTGTAAAQSTVVRSTGPSATKYPAGTKFKANQRITLADGDKLVVMQGGKTRTLSGRGEHNTGAVIAANQTMGGTMIRMMAKRPSATKGGASRGDEITVTTVRAPNLWLLDYREGGNFCVSDPATLMLWRPLGKGMTTVTVTGANTSGTVEIPADSEMRRWPANVPLQYGVDYQLSGGGLTGPVTIRLTQLTTRPDTPESAYDLLSSNGCSPQVERLVDAMSQDETATPG